MVYEIDGYFAAPGYFSINPSTGVITVKSDLTTDVATSYLVMFHCKSLHQYVFKML